MKKFELIYKQVGETPLEALERFRAEQIAAGHAEFVGVPMTYAGRLDPMAEGVLLILIGDECKNKERWLGLDKEYEVEIVFGIVTDTYDALGLARVSPSGVADRTKSSYNVPPLLDTYIGRFTQEYPPYSSRTVNGVPLHELARAGELPASDDMPTKEVEIYSIELLEQKQIQSAQLLSRIINMIEHVKGDFRQDEIQRQWHDVLQGKKEFASLKLRVRCSSGTYMRSLAHRIGKDSGPGAYALTIKRTKIFMI